MKFVRQKDDSDGTFARSLEPFYPHYTARLMTASRAPGGRKQRLRWHYTFEQSSSRRCSCLVGRLVLQAYPRRACDSSLSMYDICAQSRTCINPVPTPRQFMKGTVRSPRPGHGAQDDGLDRSYIHTRHLPTAGLYSLMGHSNASP